MTGTQFAIIVILAICVLGPFLLGFYRRLWARGIQYASIWIFVMVVALGDLDMTRVTPVLEDTFSAPEEVNLDTEPKKSKKEQFMEKYGRGSQEITIRKVKQPEQGTQAAAADGTEATSTEPVEPPAPKPTVSSGLPSFSSKPSGMAGSKPKVVFRGTSMPTGGPIRLTKQPSGHFEADLALNGYPVHFIVDTGATHVSLSKDTAQKIGIRTDMLDYNVPFKTANGIAYSAKTELDSIAFGTQTERGFPVYVSSAEGRANLLGMSYLSQFTNIAIEGKIMILTP